MQITDDKVVLCRSVFGKWKNPKTKICETVEKFTWKTANLLEVSLITFGARIIEVIAPDREGNCEDILMGSYNLKDIVKDEKHCFGSSIGPVAGIIKNGEFCTGGKFHRIARNFKSRHCINGGRNGFSKVNWSPYIEGTEVILSHATDGSNGYPGIVLAQISFTVRANNKLIIKTTARTNQVTPFDVSNRLFFNLASHNAGVNELKEHLVTVKASQTCQRNDKGLFKKTTMDVTETNFDARSFKKVGEMIADSGTIDCLFVNDKKQEHACSMLVSRIVHPQSGRVLEVHSNQPTLHFSTCPDFPESADSGINDELTAKENDGDAGECVEHLTLEYLRTKLTDKEIEFFKCRTDSDSIKIRTVSQEVSFGECQSIQPATDIELSELIRGKGNSAYCKNSGFSISCHNFPNAVNHQRKHPEILLKPGQIYENLLLLKFGVHTHKKKIDDEIHFPVKASIYENFSTTENFHHVNTFC